MATCTTSERDGCADVKNRAPQKRYQVAGLGYPSPESSRTPLFEPVRTRYPWGMKKQAAAVSKAKPQKFEGVSVRTDDDVDARFDRVAIEMGKRAAGVVVKRGSVARAALLRGLQEIEKELGIAS